MRTRTHGIKKSAALLKRSDAVIVRGCQGHKRNHEMLEKGYPVFTDRASGARFRDVDGNEYLDYLLGFGPILLGHDDPAVSAAVRKQLKRGTIYTTAHPKEIEVAEKLLDLIPWAGMVAFVIGGSAATSAAVRLARAYTGRDRVIRCGYHGWHDWTRPGSPGVPQTENDPCLAMLRGCLRRGFYLHPSHVWFLSLAHTEQDIEDTIAAVEQSIAELNA